MFVTVALVAGGIRRGQNLTDLAESTGRRKGVLRKVLVRLKAQGIAREISGQVYRLTDDFADQYERVLKQSGITYAERDQRRRHDEDRKRRDAKLGVDKPKGGLYGKERNKHNLDKRNDEDEQCLIEEQRQKVGTTATTFVAEELSGVRAVAFKEAQQRWAELGGRTDDLWQVVKAKDSPWRFYRESDKALYITRKDGGWFGSEREYGDAREILEDPPEWLTKQLVKYKANPGSLHKPTAAAIAAALYGSTERWQEVGPALVAYFDTGEADYEGL